MESIRKIKPKKKIYQINNQVRIIEDRCKKRSFASNRSLHYFINDFYYKVVIPKFKIKNLGNLKQKHVDYYVQDILKRGYTPKVVVNKMSLMRGMLKAMDKQALIRKNSFYEIKKPKPVYQDKRMNEKDYTKDYNNIKMVKDPNVRRALYLQRAFGMRMREASLFRPFESIERNSKGEIIAINLIRGTKNRRERRIEVKTTTQRRLLEFIDNTYKGGNVIPATWTFKKWKDHFYYECKKAGITNDESKPHGLRQSYAQENFDRQMKRLVDEAKEQNRKVDIVKFKKIAGSVVTRYLGHCRLNILVHYIEGWNDDNFLKLKYTENVNLE